jgi:hypothetical protein
MIYSELISRDFRIIRRCTDFVHRDLFLKMICFTPGYYVFNPYSSENI